MNLVSLVATIIRKHIILPCTSSVHGQWSSVGCANSGTSAQIATGTETITVPSGNPGVIKVHLDSTIQVIDMWIISPAQSFSLIVGDNFFTINDGVQIFFSILKRHTSCAAIAGTIVATGTVYDNSTGDVIDQFSLNF